MIESLVDMYIRDSSGRALLLMLAFAVPLELLWPLSPLPLKRRLPHLLIVLVTIPLTFLLIRFIWSTFAGTGLSSEPWLDGVRRPPGPESSPAVDLRGLTGNLLPGMTYALISLLLLDFATYWLHRALHTIPILWPIHRLHHADRDLNVLTTTVAHPFEGMITGVTYAWLGVVVLRYLGPKPLPANAIDGMLNLLVLGKYQAWLIHLNMKISLGPMAWVIGNPHLHRIHHSIEERHRNKNFATFFPIWDVLFGTYYHPAPTEWPKSGLPDMKGIPKDVLGGALLPFKAWAELFRQRRFTKSMIQ